MRVKPLAVTAAFHCGAMASAGGALAVELAKVQFHPPKIPIFSNTTANRYPEEPSEIRALLASHIAEPLRFVDEIEQLYEAGARIFIEAGPGLVLSGLVDRILGGRPHTTLGLDVSERPGWLQLAHLLAQGFALGLPVNLEPWFERRGLVAMNLAQAFEQAHAKAHPSLAAWRVNGGRAEPWHAPASPPKSIAEPAGGSREGKGCPPRVINRPVAEEGTAGSFPTPNPNTFVEIERRPVVRNHDPSSMVAGTPPVARDCSEPRFIEAQGSLSQLIELQSKQQDVLWRLIEFQENLLLGRSSGGARGVELSGVDCAARKRLGEASQDREPSGPHVAQAPGRAKREWIWARAAPTDAFHTLRHGCGGTTLGGVEKRQRQGRGALRS